MKAEVSPIGLQPIITYMYANFDHRFMFTNSYDILSPTILVYETIQHYHFENQKTHNHSNVVYIELYDIETNTVLCQLSSVQMQKNFRSLSITYQDIRVRIANGMKYIYINNVDMGIHLLQATQDYSGQWNLTEIRFIPLFSKPNTINFQYQDHDDRTLMMVDQYDTNEIDIFDVTNPEDTELIETIFTFNQNKFKFAGIPAMSEDFIVTIYEQPVFKRAGLRIQYRHVGSIDKTQDSYLFNSL